MAEAVGLILGVLPMLPLAIDGWETCKMLVENTRKYSDDVKKAADKLFVQQQMFEREMEILLGCVVNDVGVARQMVADKHHPLLRDKNVRFRWDQIMGDRFDVPIKLVTETLEQTRAELTKLERKAKGEVDAIGRSVTSKASRRRMGKTWARKLDWIVSGKTRLQELIGVLRDQNADLRTMREQRAVLGPPAYASADPALPPRWSAPQARIVTDEMLRIRADAKSLLAELSSSAVCACHQMNLRLSSSPAGDDLRRTQSLTDARAAASPSPAPSGIRFRFVVTRESSAADAKAQECICLTVQSQGPAQALLGGRSYTGDAGTLDSMKPAAGKGRIRFAVEDVDLPRRNSESAVPRAVPAAPELPVIENLCGLLADLRPAGLSTDTCLGAIPNGTQSGSRYLIYPGPRAYPSTRRISLEEMLVRDDKQLLLPREERLKIALTLSLSLLHFGSYSTSWFQERWRSRDVFFFVDVSGNVIAEQRRAGDSAGDEESGLEPYVVPFRSASSPSPSVCSDAGPGLARNEQLYSLSLVLIEIAFGERLFKIYTPEKKADSTDEFAEWWQAKRIFNLKLLGKEMGPEFADVVKRCFDCDFGLGEDFSKRELQDMFYARVVCKLEDCLKKFRGE